MQVKVIQISFEKQVTSGCVLIDFEQLKLILTVSRQLYFKPLLFNKTLLGKTSDTSHHAFYSASEYIVALVYTNVITRFHLFILI